MHRLSCGILIVRAFVLVALLSAVGVLSCSDEDKVTVAAVQEVAR